MIFLSVAIDKGIHFKFEFNNIVYVQMLTIPKKFYEKFKEVNQMCFDCKINEAYYFIKICDMSEIVIDNDYYIFCPECYRDEMKAKKKQISKSNAIYELVRDTLKVFYIPTGAELDVIRRSVE